MSDEKNFFARWSRRKHDADSRDDRAVEAGKLR